MYVWMYFYSMKKTSQGFREKYSVFTSVSENFNAEN